MDVITVLNAIPIVSLSSNMEEFFNVLQQSATYSVRNSAFMRTGLNSFFHAVHEQPIINVTVKDILFDGVQVGYYSYGYNRRPAERINVNKSD